MEVLNLTGSKVILHYVTRFCYFLFLGGRFTTVEGLMHNMLEEIEKNSIWGAGDATAPDVAERMEAFKETLLLPDNNLIQTQFLILSFKHF